MFKHETVQLIMKQLLSGVSIMHDNMIIHRDLKPENLIFSNKNDFSSLKIVDFGLATYKNVDRFFNTIFFRYLYPKCGTPGFVAPEVLNMKSRTEKYSDVCDVFSCGAIFYKLLCGKSLFQAEHVNDILKLNKECQIDLEKEEFSSMSF